MIKKIKIISLLVIMLVGNSVLAQSQPKYDTLFVGNIKQVVSYSSSKDAPLILFLHGGPGSSRMKQAESFSNILQKHFTVVQWDQRGAGRTDALNKSSVPITLNLMENDTYELINLLLKKFNQKKLYLVGESWGTVLGFKMAEKHPELLNAYIAFSPVINQTKSEQIVLEKLKLDAKSKSNTEAQEELNKVKIPFNSYEDMYYSRKWMFSYDGHPFAEKDLPLLKQYMEDWSKTWLPTWNEVMKQNLFVELPKIKCPVFFFLGEKDLQTNFGIANDYFQILKAPKKKMYAFKNAGHSVLTEEAEQVQKIIIEEILIQGDKAK
ncbi:alpha/beta hydrolase [Chryseobacterium indoltheticum]|jgi:pimeloyl-ACP methyl ester carboxylesterase|uniref:alpha/beta hydrolase n=1 Tax=Chryseobacterium indoltheticum TaxID=254 RepID=UPI0019123F2B|nr:alpha/beta hydrolase [Chryseobacterium indoltheticum]QQQ29176.1 alpha/beta hydrolase [Chryseobacterium indoltheticum]